MIRAERTPRQSWAGRAWKARDRNQDTITVPYPEPLRCWNFINKQFVSLNNYSLLLWFSKDHSSCSQPSSHCKSNFFLLPFQLFYLFVWLGVDNGQCFKWNNGETMTITGPVQSSPLSMDVFRLTKSGEQKPQPRPPWFTPVINRVMSQIRGWRTGTRKVLIITSLFLCFPHCFICINSSRRVHQSHRISSFLMLCDMESAGGWNSQMVQGLRLHTPNAGGLGAIPCQGTRPHMPQLRVCMPQIKIPLATIKKIPQTTAKTQCSLINK